MARFALVWRILCRSFDCVRPHSRCRFSSHTTFGFGNDPKYRDEYSLTFSREGIHFQTAKINSDLEWTIYSRALVDADSYLLYWSSRTFTVIPKRVFQNSEQQEEFERLLTERVEKVVRKS